MEITANLNENDRSQMEIDDLPSNPDDALERLANNKVLVEAMGPLFNAYVAVKREEWRSLKFLSMDDEVNLLLRKY